MPRNARAEVYVINTPRGSTGGVSEYNATTGEVIRLDFIRGLDQPFGLAVSGDTLFVSDATRGTVGKYDTAKKHVITANFITGLRSPAGLALLGNTLFVTNQGSGTVGEYDATTGAAINANFITGLNLPGWNRRQERKIAQQTGISNGHIIVDPNSAFAGLRCHWKGVGDFLGRIDCDLDSEIMLEFCATGARPLVGIQTG
jgi:hypothetical protein